MLFSLTSQYYKKSGYSPIINITIVQHYISLKLCDLEIISFICIEIQGNRHAQEIIT